jgi:hypothetical protein
MSKVYTQIVFQMVPGGLERVSEASYEYSGPVAQCKGEGNALKEKDRANRIQDEEIARQNAIYDQMKAGFSKYTEGNGIGFDPQQMALLTSQFMNDNASQYQQAGAGVRSALASRGMGTGEGPEGGDYVRGISGLMSGRANNLSGGMANLKLADLQQALTNKFNAGSLLSGNAATLNSPIGTMGQMSTNAFNQYMQAKNSGFGANFMKSFGAGLGGGLASMVAPGRMPIGG